MSLAWVTPSGAIINFPAGTTEISGSVEGLDYKAVLGVGIGPLYQWNAFVSDQDYAPGLWADPAARWYAPSQRATLALVVALGHPRLHDIDSILDHTSTATPGQILQANANGLPVDATNTDAQVAAAVAASHARLHVLTSALDHSPGVNNVYLQWLNNAAVATDVIRLNAGNLIEIAQEVQLDADLDLNDFNINLLNTNVSQIGDPATVLNTLYTRIVQSDDDLTLMPAAGHVTTTALPIVSTLAIGTAPFQPTSTTLCTNLNADLLDGSHAAAFAPAFVSSNLTATAPIAVTNAPQIIGALAADISHSAAAGYIHLPVAGVANQILKNSGVAGTGAWGTVTENAGALADITTISMSNQLTNTLAIGTKPLAVTSTTMCDNLNADLLDGSHKAAFLLLAGGTMTGDITMTAGEFIIGLITWRDHAAWDYSTGAGTLTADGAWHTKDASAIITAGATNVIFLVRAENGWFTLRKTGTTNAVIQIGYLATIAAFAICPLDASRRFDYNLTAGTTNYLQIVGWL